jgi:hypothetical protein
LLCGISTRVAGITKAKELQQPVAVKHHIQARCLRLRLQELFYQKKIGSSPNGNFQHFLDSGSGLIVTSGIRMWESLIGTILVPLPDPNSSEGLRGLVYLETTPLEYDR